MPSRRSVTVVIAMIAMLVVALLGRALLLRGLATVVVVAILTWPAEALFRRHQQRRLRSGLRTDIAHAIAGPLLTAVATVAGLVASAAILIPAFLVATPIRAVFAVQPVWVRGLEAFVLTDFLAYWGHRVLHRVPLLWRFHSVHHSSRQLDGVAAFRTHPGEALFVATLFLPLIVLGPSANAGMQAGVLVGALMAVRIALGVYLHANVRWKLWRLRTVVVTPEYHHWHHADDSAAIDKNFAAFLPLWDRVFGTYFMPADRRPTMYGTLEPVPETYVAQLRYPFRGLRGRVRVELRNAAGQVLRETHLTGSRNRSG